MRLLKNSENIVGSMLCTTIKSWRITASKEYMRRQYTRHAAALKATTIVSSVVMPSAMQNAVEKRILRSLIQDMKVWLEEKHIFEAEDRRSEKYRNYLTANKYARLVLQEAFDDLHDKHDKECGSTELRVYNLAECCRILKCPLSKSSIDEASAILDPEQSGIISFENFSMWWFSGQRSVPKGAEYFKLSANINILHRYAKSKRGLYRAYTSIGFIKRRIKRKKRLYEK